MRVYEAYKAVQAARQDPDNKYCEASVTRGDWTQWEREVGEYDDWLSLM
jgi:hypothetical protein